MTNKTASEVIAQRAKELGLSNLDISTTSLPFSDLSDGQYFYLAMLYGYGSGRVLQKVLEDGEHNAVWADATHIGELLPTNILCIPTTKPEV